MSNAARDLIRDGLMVGWFDTLELVIKRFRGSKKPRIFWGPSRARVSGSLPKDTALAHYKPPSSRWPWGKDLPTLTKKLSLQLCGIPAALGYPKHDPFSPTILVSSAGRFAPPVLRATRSTLDVLKALIEFEEEHSCPLLPVRVDPALYFPTRDRVTAERLAERLGSLMVLRSRPLDRNGKPLPGQFYRHSRYLAPPGWNRPNVTTYGDRQKLPGQPGCEVELRLCGRDKVRSTGFATLDNIADMIDLHGKPPYLLRPEAVEDVWKRLCRRVKFLEPVAPDILRSLISGRAFGARKRLARYLESPRNEANLPAHLPLSSQALSDALPPELRKDAFVQLRPDEVLDLIRNSGVFLDIRGRSR